MKQEVVFLVTLSLLAMTALSVIRVHPGPVKVKQGNNVTLWCQFTDDSQEDIPVLWQSPPDFKTRTSKCQTFGSSSVKQKYVMSCAENNTSWYNMTITDLRWVDRGKYRCIHYKHSGIVDLQVLVPVREVSFTHISNITSEPLVLSKGVDAVLTCKTNCAYPAPSISWFENDELFNGSASVNKTELGCTGEKDGQKRTISTITVTGKYVDKARKESKIFCVAENIIGEPTVSTAMDIIYDVTTQVTTSQPQVVVVTEHPESIALLLLGGGVGLLGLIIIVIIIVIIIFRKKKREVKKKLLSFTPTQSQNDNMSMRSSTDMSVFNLSNNAEPQPVVVADLVDVRRGSGDSEHNTESQ